MLNIFEYRRAVKMLNDEWDLGKTPSKSKGNICAWIYLMEILCVTEELVKYKEKGKLIGYCGYSKTFQTNIK